MVDQQPSSSGYHTSSGKELFPEWLRMINRWAHKIMLYIAEIALATMVFIVFMTVVLRYCFNTGIGWAEEVPRLLVTLFAFLAMAFGVRDHIHISVNIVYNRCGPVGKWWFDKVSDSAVLLCGLYMFLYGGERLLKMATLPGTLPMTGWPIWVQYLPIPLCGFLITFDSLLFITGILKRMTSCIAKRDRLCGGGKATGGSKMTTAGFSALILMGGFFILMFLRIPVTFAMLIATVTAAAISGLNIATFSPRCLTA